MRATRPPLLLLLVGPAAEVQASRSHCRPHPDASFPPPRPSLNCARLAKAALRTLLDACPLLLPPSLSCARLAKQQLRILIFPGTEVLYKTFPDVPRPEGHHVLLPAPDQLSPEEAADAMEVACIASNMVACVAAACGEPITPGCLGMSRAEVAQAQPLPPLRAPGAPGGAAPAPRPAAQQQQAAAPPPAAGQQQYAQPQAAQQQQQQQQPRPPQGAGDAYERMIAAAMQAADKQFAAGGAAPAPAGGAWGQPQHAPQPMYADDSGDEPLSSDSEADDDEPPAKRLRED